MAAGLGVAIAKLALFCTSQPYIPLAHDPKILPGGDSCCERQGSRGFRERFKAVLGSRMPVLFLKELPRASKRMTGMAFRVGGRPAIVLGFNHAQHARQLFVLAHELGHIVHEHIGADGVIINEDISAVRDTLVDFENQRKDVEEREADAFALSLIRRGHPNPVAAMGRLGSAAAIAAKAVVLGRELGIDPGHLILSYGKEHNDWARANQALGYSPSQASAIDVVAEYFRKGVDLDALSAENQEFLLAIQGFNE